MILHVLFWIAASWIVLGFLVGIFLEEFMMDLPLWTNIIILYVMFPSIMILNGIWTVHDWLQNARSTSNNP